MDAVHVSFWEISNQDGDLVIFFPKVAPLTEELFADKKKTRNIRQSHWNPKVVRLNQCNLNSLYGLGPGEALPPYYYHDERSELWRNNLTAKLKVRVQTAYSVCSISEQIHQYRQINQTLERRSAKNEAEEQTILVFGWMDETKNAGGTKS